MIAKITTLALILAPATASFSFQCYYKQKGSKEKWTNLLDWQIKLSNVNVNNPQKCWQLHCTAKAELQFDLSQISALYLGEEKNIEGIKQDMKGYGKNPFHETTRKNSLIFQVGAQGYALSFPNQEACECNDGYQPMEGFECSICKRVRHKVHRKIFLEMIMNGNAEEKVKTDASQRPHQYLICQKISNKKQCELVVSLCNDCGTCEKIIKGGKCTGFFPNTVDPKDATTSRKCLCGAPWVQQTTWSQPMPRGLSGLKNVAKIVDACPECDGTNIKRELAAGGGKYRLTNQARTECACGGPLIGVTAKQLFTLRIWNRTLERRDELFGPGYYRRRLVSQKRDPVVLTRLLQSIASQL